MRRIITTLVLVAILCTLAVNPAGAQGFNQIAFNTFTANVTLTTTSETVIVSSGPALVTRQTVNVCVMAWAQLTTGTNTTDVTPRIRRGTATSGTLVGEANAETILAAAASTEPYHLMVCEERTNVDSIEYSLTLQQTAASANGSALQGGIIVFVK